MPSPLGFLAPIGRALQRFTYDAVTTTNKRRAAVSVLRSEDDELQSGDRRALVATTRDLRRNFAIAAWAIRKHIAYVSRFNFQAQTDSETLNKTLEAWHKQWSRRGHFSARHGRHRYMAIAEACRTLDGDVFHQLQSRGLLAGIEGDRIRNPIDADNFSPDQWCQGVYIGGGEAAKGYALHDRTGGGGFQYVRTIPARYILHHGYFDRFDQWRGVSPIASAINTFGDTYNAIELAMVKAKVSQLFALVLKTNKAEEIGIHSVTESVDADGDDVDDHDKYDVDFGQGPIKLEIDPEEEAEFLESATPSTQFQDFCGLAVNIALKSIDIPTSWFFEDLTNYSGQRQAWLLYEDSAEDKREDNRQILDEATRWRMALDILDGRLVLPGRMTVEDVRFQYLARGVPWLQPLQEVKADETALDLKITSRQRICRRRGDDWREILTELEAEEKAIAERLPAAPAPTPAGPPQADPPQDQDEADA